MFSKEPLIIKVTQKLKDEKNIFTSNTTICSQNDEILYLENGTNLFNLNKMVLIAT
jgi:hypothetical protein